MSILVNTTFLVSQVPAQGAGKWCGYKVKTINLSSHKQIWFFSVHLLVDVDPQFGVHRLLKQIKGLSSRILRQEFPHLRRLPSLWTNSYFVATVGGAPLEIIKQYQAIY